MSREETERVTNSVTSKGLNTRQISQLSNVAVEKMCHMEDTDRSATIECSTFSVVYFESLRKLSIAPCA